jgi:hypothetical protein
MHALAAADPVTLDDLDGWAVSIEGQRSLARLLREPIQAGKVRLPRLPVRSLAAASALLLIIGVVATRTRETSGGTAAPESTTASEVLRNAGLVAARSVSPQPGQWIYMKLEGQGTATRDVNGRQITALIPTRIEAWVSHDDGSARVVSDVMAPRFLSSADEGWWRAAGSPAFSEIGRFEKVVPAGGQHDDLTEYPTDAEDLYAFLKTKAQSSNACPQPKSSGAVECPSEAEADTYVFTAASDLLFNHPEASPELRSALFEAMSLVPGTELDRNATDPSGRPAAAVSLIIEENGPRAQRHEMYFDPEKARVQGFRDVFTGPGASEEIYAYAVLLRDGIVDEAGQRP